MTPKTKITIAGKEVNILNDPEAGKVSAAESGYWLQTCSERFHRPGWFISSTGCLLREYTASDEEVDAWYEEWLLLREVPEVGVKGNGGRL